MSRALCLILLVLIVTACAPQPEVVIPTLMVLPSVTPTDTPTDTPVPSTPTPPPTETPTEVPTETPTEMPTEIPTDTATAEPPTDTPTPTETLPPETTPEVTFPEGNAVVSNAQGVNLRAGPSNTYAVLRRLDDGTPLLLIGRTANSQYYEAETLNGQMGWVYAPLVETSIDTNSLPVTWIAPTATPISAGSAQTAGSFALGGHVLELNPNTVSLAQRSGMTWIKMQYRYSLGDSAASLAGMINTAHASGFRLLVSIVGQTAEMGNLESYFATYSQFVSDVAALGVDGIEVWNEPNIDREWPSGQIHGANYTRLLQVSYNAIKSRNPNVLVISGAPAPIGFFGGSGCEAGGCNDDVFMQQMADASAAQSMDCVGIHYNEGILPPSATSGDPRGEYPTRYFNGMIQRTQAAFGSEPICITELGYLSPEGYGPLPPAFAWAANTTAAQQAQWLGETVRLARQNPQIRLLIVWNVDFPFYGDDPSAGYAIFRPGGGCPACDTLGAAMR